MRACITLWGCMHTIIDHNIDRQILWPHAGMDLHRTSRSSFTAPPPPLPIDLCLPRRPRRCAPLSTAGEQATLGCLRPQLSLLEHRCLSSLAALVPLKLLCGFITGTKIRPATFMWLTTAFDLWQLRHPFLAVRTHRRQDWEKVEKYLHYFLLPGPTLRMLCKIIGIHWVTN